MTEDRPESERLAVLEHRADGHDHTFQKIEGWMHEMRNFVAELVKLQTERAHDSARIERIEQSLQSERQARQEHDGRVDLELQSSKSNADGNANWIEWGKRLTLMVAGALVAYFFANPPV